MIHLQGQVFAIILSNGAIRAHSSQSPATKRTTSTPEFDPSPPSTETQKKVAHPTRPKHHSPHDLQTHTAQ